VLYYLEQKQRSARLQWPTPCLFCGRVARQHGLCAGCMESLPWNRQACPVCALPQTTLVPHRCAACAARAPSFDVAWSAFRYEAPIERAIHGLKYHAKFHFGALLGGIMAIQAAQRPGALPQLLIPVPLHSTRLRWRGYNQALELARGVHQHAAINVDADAVRRVRATADQIGKTARDRAKNIVGAFVATRDLQGLHVAIIDDVMTTGSTVGEVARICRDAGAALIEVWTVARAP
jgi:ComF family protein